ncbi:HORMA-1 domain-containing protein [Polyangium jinanense]|uniref:Bacterial HORMA domain-containing protein n=1 Tax=Polyangium jinanense TaxID=2829994 RepID=A0A9X4ARV8_9BACT|nr:hypothetical protein [Polyangium jinanense]MDC3956338.1 hypothetical protein [Polyangium jinanense]MDC3982474.1 hypothetical protein [Polyangium jinanense]
MIKSYTASHASTFTEARARAVLHNVLEDFMQVANAGFVARETIKEWFDELSFAVLHNVVNSFQLQFMLPDGRKDRALHYEVRDDGTVPEGSKGGGFDLYGLPRNTRVILCVSYRGDAPNLDKVLAWLRERGWGSGGSLVQGNTSQDRAFSRDGFGFVRSKVGDL